MRPVHLHPLAFREVQQSTPAVDEACVCIGAVTQTSQSHLRSRLQLSPPFFFSPPCLPSVSREATGTTAAVKINHYSRSSSASGWLKLICATLTCHR